MCLFEQFDTHRFCRRNTNRTIAFLGDSITWQRFNSLDFLLGETDGFDSGRKTMIKTSACNLSTKLIWMRDNYATADKTSAVIKQSDPDTILFHNRGAHYTNVTTLALECQEALDKALEWQQDCDERSDKQDCLLVWRTTAPGFPDCGLWKSPIDRNNRDEAEGLITNPSNPWYKAEPKRGVFHGWDFRNQNSLAENTIQHQIEAHPPFRISIIDFYDMAVLRPDNHIGNGDCLHWCLPGPIDAANAVLLHEMEAAASLSYCYYGSHSREIT